MKKYFTPLNQSSKSLGLIGAGCVIICIVGIAYGWRGIRGGTKTPSQALVSDKTPTTEVPSSEAALQSQATQKPHSAGTVVTIIQRLNGASQFISIFKSTGVAEQISGVGPYTIFVPTNTAFNHLPSDTLAQMTTEQEKRFIEYHIIAGHQVDMHTQPAGTIQTLSDDALNFSYGPAQTLMVGGAIVIKAYPASNGVVYLIDNILLPPRR